MPKGGRTETKFTEACHKVKQGTLVAASVKVTRLQRTISGAGPREAVNAPNPCHADMAQDRTKSRRWLKPAAGRCYFQRHRCSEPYTTLLGSYEPRSWVSGALHMMAWKIVSACLCCCSFFVHSVRASRGPFSSLVNFFRVVQTQVLKILDCDRTLPSQRSRSRHHTWDPVLVRIFFLLCW